MDTKICKICGRELPLNKFQFRKDTGKYRNQCKECLNEIKNKRHKNNHIHIENKICNVCGRKLSIDNFYKDNRSKDGHLNKCKDCCKKYTKICEHCGNKFITTDKTAKFCSIKCMGKSRDNKTTVECDYCGKSFNIPKHKVINDNHHYCSNECRQSSSKHILCGEQHPRFNPNLTEEDREKHRDQNHEVWAYEVKIRDNFTCQCCGNNKSGTLVSHHLNGYNWDKEHRYDVDNGITLCIHCHSEFHKIYGYGNNTKEQFDEFLNKYMLKLEL